MLIGEGIAKDERDKQSRETHIHAQQVIYQEQGKDAVFGNKIVFMEHLKELDEKLDDLRHDLKRQVTDSELRSLALQELENIRDALHDLRSGTDIQQRSALEELSHFADGMKEGSSKTVTVLKSIKEGGEAISQPIPHNSARCGKVLNL